MCIYCDLGLLYQGWIQTGSNHITDKYHVLKMTGKFYNFFSVPVNFFTFIIFGLWDIFFCSTKIIESVHKIYVPLLHEKGCLSCIWMDLFILELV